MAGDRKNPQDALVEAARAYADHLSHGLTRCDEVRLVLADGRKVRIPVFPLCSETPNGNGHFVPSPFQQAILEALEDKALRTDALGRAVNDRSRLFRHPGGLKELREQGLVDNHPRLGYYRPDAPPPEIPEDDPAP